MTEQTKICSKCEVEKPATIKYFQWRKDTGKYRNECKVCINEYNSKWKRKHPEKILELSRKYERENHEKIRKRNRKWAKANSEKMRESRRKYREQNIEKLRKSNRENARKLRKEHPKKMREIAYKWRKANPEKAKASYQRYRKANPKKILEATRKRRQKNPGKYKAMQKEYNAKVRATPRGKLNYRISNAIRSSLKGNKNGKHWEDIVGFTLEQLKKHLEKLFTEGMTWGKLLSGEIHLDHKIPVNAFNFTKPEHRDFKRCWALKNLQPLWAIDNLEKNAKLENHFQPSLLM